MNNEYDISKAFRRIEETLIKSYKKNLTKHFNEENLEDMNWTAWQIEELKTLEEYRKNNKNMFKNDFITINSDIEELIKQSYESGKLDQEKIILESIKNGTFNTSNKKINKLWHIYSSTKNNRIKKKQLKRIYENVDQIESTFFKLNERKLNALVQEATEGIKKAENSILRYTNDWYRQIIYDAQVYANTGAGTIQQAVDMASKDFLSAGINNIEYSNGAKVNIVSYVEMAIRTANKRAYLQGEGEKRQEWGIHTVLVPNRGGGCPYCIKFQGKVFIDDVYSGGTKKESQLTGYPLLSKAIENRLFHPNCKDGLVTYFPGVNFEVAPPTKSELNVKIENYKNEQKLKSIDRNIDKYKRLELGATDTENIEKYHRKRLEWQEYKEKFKYNNYEMTNDKSNGIIDAIEYVRKNKITDNRVLDEKIHNVKKRFPDYINKYIENTPIEVIGKGKNNHYLDGKLYFLNNATEWEIIHEIGHIIEERLDIANDSRYLNILKKNIGEIDVFNNVIGPIDGYDPDKYEFLLSGNNFISDYQRRVYNIDINKKDRINYINGTFNYNVFRDYFPEGLSCYFENKQLLKLKNNDLYQYIEEVLRERK